MAKIKPARRSAPKPAHKQFFSLRQVRLASTAGHTAIIYPNQPITLPRELWNDAYRAGAMEYDPELIRAAARAIDSVEAKPLDFDTALGRAVKAIVAAAKPSELSKTTGAPKIAVVKREMQRLGVDPKGLTMDQIYDTFTALVNESDPAEQNAAPDEDEADVDTTDLEDEDGVLEPVGKGVAGLIGEAGEADADEE